MAVPNYLQLKYTENGGGSMISFAYHDFVLSMEGLSVYQNIYPNITDFKYKLILVNSGGVEVELQVPPNKLGYGIFNISSIIQDSVKTDESGYDSDAKNAVTSTLRGVPFTEKPHSVHEIDRFCRNRDNLRWYTFATQCSFFSNGTFIESFSQRPKFNPNSKTVLLPFYFFWNSCRPFYTQQAGQLSANNYFMNTAGKYFLTNKRANCKRNVVVSDFETLGFINGQWQIPNGYGAAPTVYVTSSVHVLEITGVGNTPWTLKLPNTSANAGSYPTIFQQTYPNAQFPATEDEGLLYVGIGPQNLINNEIQKVGGGFLTANDFANIDYYEVKALNSTGGTISETIRYDVIDENCKYERVRLAYLNRLGAYDYVNFTKKSTKSTEITRSNYNAHYGYLPLQVGNSNLNNKWEYGSYEGGTRSYNTNAITTIEANSDWLNDADAEALKELFTSPVAYLQIKNEIDGRYDTFVAVVCTEKDYTLQTTDNDKLKQYVVTIQLGQEQRVQRL